MPETKATFMPPLPTSAKQTDAILCNLFCMNELHFNLICRFLWKIEKALETKS